jgi:membrane protein required for colicin V production
MILDIIVLAAVGMAIFQGMRKGLVVAIFSFVALLVGIAAAIKCSALAGSYLSEHLHTDSKWTPVVGFLLVFFIAVLLVRLGGKFIESLVEMATLGWVNKIGGVLFYILLYLMVVSIGIFYAEKSGIAGAHHFEGSVTYPWVEPWGPAVIDLLGMVIPWFKGMFTELESFFESLARKLHEV